MTDICPVIQVKYEQYYGEETWETVAMPPHPTWGALYERLDDVVGTRGIPSDYGDDEWFIGDWGHTWFTLEELSEYAVSIMWDSMFPEITKWVELGHTIEKVYNGKVRFVYGYV